MSNRAILARSAATYMNRIDEPGSPRFISSSRGQWFIYTLGAIRDERIVGNGTVLRTAWRFGWRSNQNKTVCPLAGQGNKQ